jgi:CBS domain-containing protein
MGATVRDVMTTSVVAVREDTSFKDAAIMLADVRISAVPVVDETGRVIGVVSEADLLLKVADRDGQPGLAGMLHHHEHQQEHQKAAALTAADLMTTPAVTISPAESVQQAACIMYDRKVKRLPVVDVGGHLIGIVSRADVLSVFTRPDEDIRRVVTDRVIRHSFLLNPAAFTVTVRDGVVTLSGHPENDQAGRDIVAAVRHVEGVVGVRDRLSYTAEHPPGRYHPHPIVSS